MKQVGIILGPVLILAFLGNVGYTCISLGLKMKRQVFSDTFFGAVSRKKWTHPILVQCLYSISRKRVSSLSYTSLCGINAVNANFTKTKLESTLHIRIKAEILSFQLTKLKIWAKTPENWCKRLYSWSWMKSLTIFIFSKKPDETGFCMLSLNQSNSVAYFQMVYALILILVTALFVSYFEPYSGKTKQEDNVTVAKTIHQGKYFWKRDSKKITKMKISQKTWTPQCNGSLLLCLYDG